jgi:hypothetical protein
MIVAWGEKDLNALFKKFPIKPGLALLLVGTPVLFYLAHQVIMLQWEIKDYHQRGASHKVLVDLLRRVYHQLPHDQPLVFIDLGRRRAVDELVRSVQGYRKLLFVRQRAIWQQVFLAPLVNFIGNPFSERLTPLPDRELDTVFQHDFTALVFIDNGFFISPQYKAKVRDYYQKHHQLPYKVQVLRFLPVKEKP